MQGQGGAPLLTGPGATGNSPQPDGAFMRQMSDNGPSHSLEWTDINFAVGEKQILRGVTGNLGRGEMACILGPSGSGKSTLLNILAGRMNTQAKGMTFSGNMSLSGTTVDRSHMRALIAYVMQEDALPAMMTPRELLKMSAALRLGQQGSAMSDQVNRLLTDLKLEKCADTRVGSSLVRGISGGEKKRTAVAIELITKPKMMFLDEPLSGLDSYAAWTVVQVLRQLAEHGCPVLCTIHQPSSEIFQSFQKMLCLTEGSVCYCGSVASLPDYMARVGYPVPEQYNPADHILFFVQAKTTEERTTFIQAWKEQESKTVLKDIQEVRRAFSQVEMPSTARKRSFFIQLGYLARRELNETLRDRMSLFFRFFINGIMGCLFACIFQGVGSKDDLPGGLQSHFGAVVNIMIGTMFSSAQPLLLQFPLERPIFLREYASNMYGSVPYFLAKAAVELPLSFLTVLETWLISYFIMELKGNFFGLVFASWGLACGGASTALLIGCNISEAKAVQEVAPLMFVPQILFSGIFIAISLIPIWLRWLQYVCALKYAINLGCIAEFQNLPGGEEFLQSQNIQSDKVWLYIVVLVGIFCGFRLIALFGLRKKAAFVF